ISQSLIVDFRDIKDLNEWLPRNGAPSRMIRSEPDRLAQEIGEWAGDAAHRDGTEPIAVGYVQAAACSTAEAMRLFQYRVENRGDAARRGVDDLQPLGCSGLLFERLARFGQQPRILYGNDRLRREILQQRDLLVGEWSDRLTIDIDVAK